MRIIGIDPGLHTAGYAVLEGRSGAIKAVDYGAIRTSSGLELPARLAIIYNEVSELIDMYNPSEIAVEELFFGRNMTTAFTVGQARGVFLLAAEQKGLAYFQYTPLQVKQAVSGYGRAGKQQVQQMVKMLLALEAVPKPDDVADALAVGICHLQNRKLP